MSLEDKLNKIRSPNLQSQQHTKVVLESIEETLKEQKASFTPTAYFAALFALLKQSTTPSRSQTQDELIVSAVYLLDLITSHVPASILRSQFTTVVSLLAPYLDPSNDNAPLIRSALGALESILTAQDSAAWNLSQSQISPRQALAALLSFSIDPRPKIRKRSHEALTNILKNPPPGPSVDHPGAELCAIAAQNNLKTAVDDVHQVRKQKGRPDDSHDPTIIHALQLTKTVANASGGWPSKKIEQLCEMLLSISRSKNDYLVMSAFEVFEVILAGMSDEFSSTKLPRLLDAIVELKPPANDSQLLPPWIAILSRGYGVAAELDPEDTFAKLPELFDLAAGYLISPSHNVRVSASECLISFFANCIPASVILDPSIYDEKILQKLAVQALNLLSVRYQTAWMEVFRVLSGLFDALRWRGDPYLLSIVQAIGELRGNEGFQGKKDADEVLGHAIRNLGPQAVLSVLPHNLLKPKPKQPGRAWLLPLLRDHVSNTTLQHFKTDLIPLSEAMYQRVIDHGSADKTVDIKIFETVVQQVWTSLPGYCDLPLDLQSAVDQPFAEMISNILYKQPELRVDLCRGLQNLVESNQSVLESELSDDVLQLERRTTKAEAEANLAHLAGFSSNLLAVLFNVYSQTLPQSRSYILQCINSYLSITAEKDLVDTFERVANMLQAALPAPGVTPLKKDLNQPTKDKLPATSHTLLDLVIALSIHLPRTTFAPLFALASNVITNTAVLTSDPQLIKKAYKLIPRLSTSPTGSAALKARNAELQALILSTADKTPVPARRDRILAINTLISFLPSTDLHFVPSILSEVVLACKDTNEKARTAGFDTLLAATAKIIDQDNPAGTTIKNHLVPHMPDDAVDAPATLEEVFTMVSAGLAGVAPHMVAATIIALSRLTFEYHNDANLSPKMKAELVDTVTMFLQSNNREIVRAVLGFVKVMVVVLPLEMLEPRCEAIVPGLMIWSKENKGRLRVKVKGILERLIRRFGSAKVESWVGPEDRKMVVNIRKRRERARRKKIDAGEIDSEDEENAPTAGQGFDNEFDDTVYGSDVSDSEREGSDGAADADDVSMSGVSFKAGSRAARSEASTRGRNRKQQQFIRQDEDEDEPLDLLDPKSMASISSRKNKFISGPKTLHDQSQHKSRARYNEDGKLVFNLDLPSNPRRSKSKVSNEDGDEENEAAQGDAINAYLDAVDGPDAIRRGQKGRLKVRSGAVRDARKLSATSFGGDEGDDMNLDVDQAREVARRIMAKGSSSSAPSSPGSKIQKQNSNRGGRRGLGIDKRKGQSQKTKFRGGAGVNKKGVRFSRHPRR